MFNVSLFQVVLAALEKLIAITLFCFEKRSILVCQFERAEALAPCKNTIVSPVPCTTYSVTPLGFFIFYHTQFL